MLEYTLGSKKFFNYYFITGIGGYVLYMFIQAIEVHSITGTFTIANPAVYAVLTFLHGRKAQELLTCIYVGPILGASGAIFGILVGICHAVPEPGNDDHVYSLCLSKLNMWL
jgi:membrane associated rhomboid family serine protease